MKNKIILGLIIFIAFIIRLWGVNFGLPDFYFHVDENFIAHHTLRIYKSGEIVTSQFVPPLLYYRLLITLYSFLLWFSKVFTFQIDWTPRSLMIIIGRLVSVATGTLTVYFIYKIGREMFNKRIGLLAAFLLSFTFVHVVKSHYVKYDITAAFWGTFSFLYAFYILKTQKARDYFLTGTLVGLAVSTHFPSAFFLIPPLVAHWLSVVKNRKPDVSKVFSSKLLLLFLGLTFSFFLINPYLLSAPQEFLRGMAVQKEAIKNAPTILSKGNIPTPLWYLFYLSSSGVYYPMFLLTILGVYPLIRRRKKKDILLLSFPLVYLTFLFLNSYRTDRLALPLMPFFALYSAIFLEEGWRKVKRMKIAALFKNIILLGSILIIFVVPLARTAFFSYSISQKDTRQLAAEWAEENYPKDQALFTIGDTINIGHYLLDKGFTDVTILFPLEDKGIFLYPGEILMVSSTTFHAAENYQSLEKYKKIWENYQVIKRNGKLIKEFAQPLFKSEFFGPSFLENSSAVNVYHNPTVEIYKIPRLDLL